MDSLLDRIFDEYGLIVCGWSGEWDVALRAAFERCNTHRYGTYWAIRGKLGKAAEKLVDLRRASVIEIADADWLFQGLQQKVEALADLSLTDPVSPRVAVAQVKRFLRSTEDRIRLHDFIMGETQRAATTLQKSVTSNSWGTPSPDSALRRLRFYEAEVGVLLPVFACIGYWGGGETFELLGRSLQTLSQQIRQPNADVAWTDQQRYAALLLFYSCGLGATAKENYGVLNYLFRLKVKPDKDAPDEFSTVFLNPGNMWSQSLQQQLLTGRQREHTPLNNYVFDLLRSPLREYYSTDYAYEAAFDWFEYVLALVYCDLKLNPSDPLTDSDRVWGPVGRFFWRVSSRPEESIQSRMNLLPPGKPIPSLVLAAAASGLCQNPNGDLNTVRYEFIKKRFDAFISYQRSQNGIFSW